MITYKTGDLFQLQEGVLAHACNYEGVWGGGIAAVFRRKFPNAYKLYRDKCLQTGSDLLGTAFVIKDGPFLIACLFTNDYTTVERVCELTRKSLLDLQSQLDPHTVVNMPKINAGIFNVPWECTEKAIESVDGEYCVYVL